MLTPVQVSKQALRQQVSARLKALTAAERAGASAQAGTLLKQQPIWQAAHSILFFAPLSGELDVWPLLLEALAAGKTVALPRFNPATGTYSACRIRDHANDLQSGQFGIREPNARCAAELLNCLDLILVPGVAFDPHGRRLGRGSGFYDQLLATMRGWTCGVAFDEQLVGEIPVEPHDRHLNCILTPTRWLQL
jgi:5-formyltetrahydrofolate cyclo-ligase